MNLIIVVTIAAVASGILSLIGGLIVLYSKDKIDFDLKYLVSFAAGSMLAAALLDILPESIKLGDPEVIIKMTLIGIIVFFIGEKTLIWHHHSHQHPVDEAHPVGILVVVGDTLHNFLDGILIAIAFISSWELGIVTTLAIIAHEIPQEIGDFAVLLNAGYNRAKVLCLNIFSSFSSLLGALLTLAIKNHIENAMPYLLGFAAGNFIYIATADLIPSIHHESNTRKIILQIICLLLGVLSVGYIISLVE